MNRVMRETMGDCSTLEEFRFLVRCQECGRTWRSSAVRFSKADIAPTTEHRRVILRTLYAAGAGGCTGKGYGGSPGDL